MLGCNSPDEYERENFCPKLSNASAICKKCQAWEEADLFWHRWFMGGILPDFWRTRRERAKQHTSDEQSVGRASAEINKTILTTLASINATILVIVFALLVAFFVYYYPALSQSKEKLSDMRNIIAQTMSMPFYTIVDSKKYSDYFKDGGILDMHRVENELFKIASVRVPEERQRSLIDVGTKPPSLQEEARQRAPRLLEILALLSRSYPYSDKSVMGPQAVQGWEEPQRHAYDEKWRDDLFSVNAYLAWIWLGQKDDILSLMTIYKKIYPEEQAARLKQNVLLATRNAGRRMTEADVQEQLRPFKNYFENLPFDRMTMEFFERVNFIQQNMIPQIRDLSYKLDFFQKQLGIKKHSTIVIIYIITLLIFGVATPLFVHISYQPSKWV